MRRIMMTFLAVGATFALAACGLISRSLPLTTLTTTMATTAPTTTTVSTSPEEGAFATALQAFYDANWANSKMRQTASMDVFLGSRYSMIAVNILQVDAMAELDLSSLYFYSTFEYQTAYANMGLTWVLIEPNGSSLLKVTCEDEFLTTEQLEPSMEGFIEAISGDSEELSYHFPGAIVTVLSADRYRFMFPLSTAFDDPAFFDFLESFGLPSPEFEGDAAVVIDFTFAADDASLSIAIKIDGIENPEDDDYYYDYEYAISISFLDTIERFTYDPADYYIHAGVRMYSCPGPFADGTILNVYLNEGRDNWILLHLTPGYYSLGHSHGDEREPSYLIDSDGNRLERNPTYFKIETEGDYYYSARVIASDKYTISVKKVSEEAIGTIADPIVDDDGSLEGTFVPGVDEYDVVLLDPSGEEGYYLIRGLEFTGAQKSVNIGWNGFSWNAGPGGETRLPVINGQPVILSLHGTYAFTYRLAYEFFPTIPVETDYALMPEVIVHNIDEDLTERPTTYMIGTINAELRLRFTVTTAGFYHFNLNHSWSLEADYEDSHSIPGVPIYTADGVLIDTSGYGTFYYLEPGDYYGLVTWHEGGYALIAPYVMYNPE